VDFLLSAGAILSARDKNPAPDAEMTEFLTSRGVTMIYGEHYLDDITEDVILKSPGIRYDIPELLQAAANGCVITSEMEIFTQICPAKIFAVTGSDGKTTTTTLVAKMLEKTAAKQGASVYLGGNIGTPLLPYVADMTENDFAVLELSSFQLHTMKTAPVSAILTNVTPNHLNWHTSMDEYVESKKNIFANQTENCRLTLNADNAVTASMADEAINSLILPTILRRNSSSSGIVSSKSVRRSCWAPAITRHFSVVRRDGENATPAREIPRLSSSRSSSLPDSSSPTAPKATALPPQVAILRITLPAPPRQQVRLFTLTTGTGASGEIRLTAPHR
jgi:UDP-N-acetylmuramoylalanine-D-glutamate ligase